jgi:RNA polymerase sigma-70 factor (ECF subfamily)
MLEEDIQQGIKNGNPKIYEYIINEYSKLLWVVASGIINNIGSKEDIEDCIADSFAYLWQYPEKYNPKRGSLKTYLCLITKSKAIDKVRKLNKTTALSYDDELDIKTDDLEEKLVNKEMVNEIYKFAKSLKQLDSEIFILRYFYQLKPSEIAVKLNISVREVSNKLYYCKKSLLTQIDI